MRGCSTRKDLSNRSAGPKGGQAVVVSLVVNVYAIAVCSSRCSTAFLGWTVW